MLLYSQSHNSNWYFGNGAGIKFSGTDIPIALQNGAINTFEGCATISDNNGNLLFYTDGVKVYNKNHQVMPNGIALKGSWSSTQSAIIVPKPGSTQLFYIFTVAKESENDGLCYSIVDMTLNNGLGDVTLKNIHVVDPICEKIVAVKHSNLNDIWIIVHLWNSNIFNCYLLSSSGLNMTPVQSAIGTTHNSTSPTSSVDNWIGYMKASSDGTLLALAIRQLSIYEIFRFNNQTGLLSEPITLSNVLSANSFCYGAYALEFSASNRYLYVKNFYPGNIYQYDLLDYNYSSVQSSKTLIGISTGNPNYQTGAMQIGPDNKIYIAKFGKNSLDVIINPDIAGISCGYTSDYVSLGSRICQLGLPNLINNNFFNNSISIVSSCVVNQTFSFSINSSIQPISYLWNFDDSLSIDNSSSIANPTHDFVQSGIHNISLIYMLSNGTIDTIYYSLNVPPSPNLIASDSIALCLPGLQDYLLCSTAGFQSYAWNTGSISACSEINSTGIYTVAAVDSSSCTILDSVFVEINPEYEFISDTMICTDEIINFYGQTIDSSGVYIQEYISQQGCDSTYILNVLKLNCSSISAQGCFLGPIVFNFNSPIVPMSYSWNFDDPLSLSNVSSESNPSHIFSEPGGYDVKLIFGLNSGFQDTIISHVEVQSYPNLIADDSIATCWASSPMIVVHSIGNMNSYSWGNGYVSDSSVVTSEGWLGLNAIDTNGCTINDSIFVSFNLEYQFNVDTSICDGEILDFFGQHVLDSGDYTQNFYTVNGCDSIYYLHVEKYNCSMFEVNACYLDSVMFVFSNPTSNASCLWHFSDTDSTFSIVQGDTVYHNFSNPGEYNISIIYTLPSGYTDTITFNQQINECPELVLEDSLFICYSTIPDYQINAESGFLNYSWSNGINQQNTDISQSGTFFISANDSMGCLIKDSVFVKFNLSNSLVVDTTICLGESYFFGGEMLDVPGVYIDSLVSDAGCDSIMALNLNILQSPTLELNDTAICFGEEIHIIPDTVGVVNGYQWSDGYLYFDRFQFDQGEWVLQVWNNCGVSIDSIKIEGIDCSSNLWFPNAFSPNGDIDNATFHGVGTNIEQFHLVIFNRWGQMLYETFSINEPWDGRYRGELCPDGVYFWVCDYTMTDSINRVKYGSVTLLR